MEESKEIIIKARANIETQAELKRGIYNNGNSLMMFNVLENNVLDFLKYVPIEYYEESEKRENVYSPFLSNILQNIVSQIDSFFRYWNVVHKVWNIKNNKVITNEQIESLTFWNYKNIEDYFSLSNKEITILSINRIMKPFENVVMQNNSKKIIKWNEWKQDRSNWKKDTKCWWNSCNHVKHNGFYAREEGNLENVIESLSALFILNCSNNEVWPWLSKYDYLVKIPKNIEGTPMDPYVESPSVDKSGNKIIRKFVCARSKLFHFEYHFEIDKNLLM